MDEYSPETQKAIKFYRSLALVLVLGVVLGVIAALGNVPSLGLVTPESAFVGLGVIALFVFIVTVLFLMRIGSIFELQKSMQQLYDGAEDRATAEQARIKADWQSFKDDLRKDLVQMRQEWRSEQGVQDRNIDDAASAARAAMKAAQAAEARAASMVRDPSQAVAIDRLNESVANLTRSVADLKARDNVNSPLLKELQEAVAALVKNQTKLIQRIDTTIESMERREMEMSALRADAEREVGELKRRDTLMAVKVRELEDLNSQLATRTRSERAQTEIRPGEEAQHVMTIEAIGPAQASRLNAAGIITVPQLLAANPELVGPKVGAGADQVREWQSIADLMRVKGIGAADAELLVKSGVRSAPHLAAADPAELTARLQDAERRKVRIGGTTVTPAQTQKWIDAARSR